MKIKLFFITILVSFSAFSQEKKVQIYPFKSAIIEYKYEAAAKGTHLKYIDEYGYKQVDIIKKVFTYGGQPENQYETIILIGSKAYTIDFQDSTVAIGRNQTYSYYLEYQDKNCLDVSEAILKVAFGYSPGGTKEYLKRECKVWTSGKSTLLTWQGIELQSEINFITMMVEKATKLKVNKKITESVFDIPQGFKYISADVYQGFSGLQLSFDTSKPTVPDDDTIEVNFSSNSLEATDNFTYQMESGEIVAPKGSNDYNKIDSYIIESQEWAMISKDVELPRFSTLIFKTNNGDWGKMQINQLTKNSFTLRYVLFNHNGRIKTYADDITEVLPNDFNFKINNKNKLIITPLGKAQSLVLGW